MFVRLIIVFSLVLLTACQKSEVNGISSQTGDDEFPPQLDLASFERCKVGELGWVGGGGEITNNTPETATYEIVVAFLADGTRMDQRSTWVRDLKSGEKASFEASKFLWDRASTVNDCEVVTINRF